MIIKATPEQVKVMEILAVLASRPMGMGILHYDSSLSYETLDLALPIPETRANLDYVQGRMVKFGGRKVSDETWEFSDTVSIEYQSWCGKYPSYQALYDAAIEWMKDN